MEKSSNEISEKINKDSSIKIAVPASKDKFNRYYLTMSK
jgi:hypothetical protein